MVRKLPLALALALTVLLARQVSAGPIIPLDLDTFDLSNLYAPKIEDDFANDLGDMANKVYLLPDGNYLYKHKVTPDGDHLSGGGVGLFHTGFPVIGFTGEAGWDFDDVPAGSFALTLDASNHLRWFPQFDWDFESVKVFFVSSRPPTLGTYFLYDAGTPPTFGEATSYAPTPEPGSMMLLGSGLAALYGAARRRRSRKPGSTPEVG